jgi:hypothetical protein
MRFEFVMKKTHKALVFAALMLLVFTSYGSAEDEGDTLWTRAYGDTEEQVACAVDRTTDGGFIVAGYTSDFDGTDFWVLKTDSGGDTLWARAYGTGDMEYAEAVTQTYDGGYIIAGWVVEDTSGFWVYNLYVVKTDADGDTTWTWRYGGELYAYAYDVEQTPDSGFVVFGKTGGPDFDDYDAYLIRLDTDGDMLWTQVYGAHDDQEGFDVELTSDGGYVLTGQTGTCPDYDAYLIKVDANGDSLWGQTYGDSLLQIGYSLRPTSDGGYIIGGITYSTSSGLPDAYIVKTNSVGDALWIRSYGGDMDDYVYSVWQTLEGSYIAAGYYGLPRDVDIYFLKLDANGDTLWTRTYGGTCFDIAYSVVQAADNSYLMAGSTCSFGAGYNDVYLVDLAGPPASGCDYVVGDVNGSDSYNGLDVTYGVAFFKGGSEPMCADCPLCPGWWYCGDVNGSCSYNGLDITYGVSYFKGGASPVPCGDCPPSGNLATVQD